MNGALVNCSSKTRSLLAWVLVRSVVEQVMVSWSLGRRCKCKFKPCLGIGTFVEEVEKVFL